jgi:hypothetical protein
VVNPPAHKLGTAVIAFLGDGWEVRAVWIAIARSPRTDNTSSYYAVKAVMIERGRKFFILLLTNKQPTRLDAKNSR